MTFLTVLLTAMAIGILVLAALILLPFLGGFLLVRALEILAPLCLTVWFLAHGRKHAPGWEKFQGIRFAHRGLHGPGVPENSLAAFRQAAEAGYGVELDVHLTKDGYLAVIHDSDLTRMCGRSGTVEELTAAELGTYRLTGSGERIPFLEQVLPIFEGKRPLIVELKTAGGNHAALAAAAMECLDRFQADYCVESFDPRCLLWLQKHRPEILRGQLAQGSRQWKTALWPLSGVCTRPDFIAYRIEDRKGPAVLLLRCLGFHLVWWTIRTQKDLDWAEDCGDIGIFENFVPERRERSMNRLTKQEKKEKKLREKKSMKQAMAKELREHRSSFIVFYTLRVLVLVVLVRQLFLHNYEGAFFCILTILLLYAPSWIQVKLHIELPPALEITILCFIFAAEILGEVNAFYVNVPNWDTMLHTLNGFLAAAVGFSMVLLLNDDERLTFDLSPFFLALVAFCFSMTIGVLWEFFEFGMDYFFHTDMQKDTVINAIYTVALDPTRSNKVVAVKGIQDVVINGESLGLGGYLDIGIIDTMKDLFVNFIGAVVFSVTGFFYARSKGEKRTAAQSFVPSKKTEETDYLKQARQEHGVDHAQETPEEEN